MVTYSLFIEDVMATLAFLMGTGVIVWYTELGEAKAEAESQGATWGGVVVIVVLLAELENSEAEYSGSTEFS